MHVSIVIPNYNGEEHIVDCIASVYNQIIKKKEIIVVDNNSTDRSIALIRKLYPNITLILNESNTGFASAVNQGIKKSRSEFVILLNNDAFAQKDFVQELYNCITKDDNIFSVSSQMLSYSNPTIIDNAGDQLTLLGWAFKTGDGEKSINHNRTKEVFSSCAGAAIYRKEVFEEIGYFDENFFAYLEDVDIGFRANIAGYRNIYCPHASVLHIGSATTGSVKYNSFKVNISARNNIYLLTKNTPILLLLIQSPLIILGFLIKILFFARVGFSKDYIRGLWEGIKSIHALKRIKFNKKNTIHYIRIGYIMAKSTIYYSFVHLSKLLKMNR